MADLDITQMTQLAIAPAATDIMYIGDLSEAVLDDQNKHIQIETLFQYLNGGYQGNIVLNAAGTLDLSVGTIHINEAVDLTATSTELNQLDGVTVGGTSPGDIVDLDTAQSLSNKTLVTPTIASFANAGHTHADAAGGGQLTSPLVNEAVALLSTATELNQLDGVSVGGNTAGDIITTDATQTMSAKTLTLPTIGDYTNATHDHTSAAEGGVIATGGLFAEDVNLNIVGGTSAGSELSAGINNFFGGSQAGQFGDGSSNVGLGYQALQGTTANTFNLNVGIGASCGLAITTGSEMVLIGAGAGGELTTAGQNVYIGRAAGQFGNGTNNVGVGYQALNGTTANSHNQNTGVGYNVGQALTTGGENVFMGYLAGTLVSTGLQNVIIGSAAGDLITAGANNTLVGYSAGTAGNFSDATFIGHQAGNAHTSGLGNTAIGRAADFWNQTGSWNTMVGYLAGQGQFGNSFSNATYVGREAGRQTTTGASNTAVGYFAGYNNETGANNVCIGREAGEGVAANSYSSNVLVGFQAATAVTTGSENLCLGFTAGDNITSGARNIVLGDLAVGTATSNDQFHVGNSTVEFLRGDMANHQLAIYGTSGYLNFNTTLGSTGYGVRDNSGVMEAKDTGGVWTPIAEKTVTLPVFDAVTAVTTGEKGIIVIPAEFNGMNLVGVICGVWDKGVTGSTNVGVFRSRGGTEVAMLSTEVTIGDEWFASDGVINATNDDVATGDLINVNISAIHSGTAPNGLTVTLQFGI